MGVTSKMFTNPELGQKVLKNIGLQETKLLACTGAPTCLGPALLTLLGEQIQKKYTCQITAHKKDLRFWLCYRVSYLSLHSYVTT
jgi:hypothetical protein